MSARSIPEEGRPIMASHRECDPLPPLPRPEERPTLKVPEAGAYLGLGYVASYEAAKRGVIPTIRTSGTRMVVPTATFRRMLGLDDIGGAA